MLPSKEEAQWLGIGEDEDDDDVVCFMRDSLLFYFYLFSLPPMQGESVGGLSKALLVGGRPPLAVSLLLSCQCG